MNIDDGLPPAEKIYYHGISGSRLERFKKTGRIPPSRQTFGGVISITDDFALAKMHCGVTGQVIEIKLAPDTYIKYVPTEDVYRGRALEHSGDILDIGEGEFLVVNPDVIISLKLIDKAE